MYHLLMLRYIRQMFLNFKKMSYLRFETDFLKIGGSLLMEFEDFRQIKSFDLDKNSKRKYFYTQFDYFLSTYNFQNFTFMVYCLLWDYPVDLPTLAKSFGASFSMKKISKINR